jgi:putative hydrolase of HD superfamily
MNNNHRDEEQEESTSNAATAAGAAIDFLTTARGLKTTKRTGWIMRKVPSVESVADHSWRISLMAMVAANSYASTLSSSASSSSLDGEEAKQPKIDANKCIQMALIHDLAEASVGDITPHCGVSEEDKHAMELKAITEMTAKLNMGILFGTCGETILSLWKEYEAQETLEAKLVKDLDRLEMILQALEYEDQYGDSSSSNNREDEETIKNDEAVNSSSSTSSPSGMMSLDQFFTSTRGKWRTPLGEQWAAEIEARRSVQRPTKQPKTIQEEKINNGKDTES